MKYYILSKEDINQKNYSNLIALNNKAYTYFDQYTFDNSNIILNKTIETKDLYEICYLEILSYLSTQKKFIKRKLKRSSEKNDKKFIFEFFESNFPKHSKKLINTANRYYNYFIDNYNHIQSHEFGIIFNGYKIRDRVFCFIFGFSKIKIFHTEYLVTGDRYFFYNTLYSIPNNYPSKNIYMNYLRLDNSIQNYSFNEVYPKVLNIIKNIRKLNLNVKSSFECKNYFTTKDNKKNLIIIGQVIDDISLFNSDNIYFSSINTYEWIINLGISNGYDVIFKLHPWEKRKLGKFYTKSYLNISNISILIDEEIDEYLNEQSLIFSISSQYLLYYAVLYGKRCICFDTYFSLEGSFINLKNDILDLVNINPNLSIDEYRKLILFLYFIFYLDKNIVKTNQTIFRFVKINQTNVNLVKKIIPRGVIYNFMKFIYKKFIK